jgi:hypothetical protein
MASISFYDHTRKLFANGQVNIGALKVMLILGGSPTAFDATHTDIDQISADEVSGNGWSAGGEAIANAAVTVVNTNESKLDGDDISVAASGDSIGPADGAVLYADMSPERYPLFFIDFQGSEEAGDGTNFNVTWNASGIATWTSA